jgi:hypothetical protein
MKAYIIKYALTDGICEVEAEDKGNGMIKVRGKESYNDALYHGKNREWCDNEEDAIKYSEELRAKKIKALERQLAKVRSLDLKVIERE